MEYVPLQEGLQRIFKAWNPFAFPPRGYGSCACFSSWPTDSVSASHAFLACSGLACVKASARACVVPSLPMPAVLGSCCIGCCMACWRCARLPRHTCLIFLLCCGLPLVGCSSLPPDLSPFRPLPAQSPVLSLCSLGLPVSPSSSRRQSEGCPWADTSHINIWFSPKFCTPDGQFAISPGRSQTQPCPRVAMFSSKPCPDLSQR